MISLSKRLLSVTLAIASVASMAWAVSAADGTPNYDEQLVVINGRYSKDRFESYFPMEQVLFPIQQKVNGDLYEFYLKNPNPLESSEILPLIQPVKEGVDVTVRTVNTSQNAYFLVVPSQDLKVYVPIQSERAVNIDMDQIPSGKSVTYFIEDANGNKVAGGYILNGELVKSPFFSASNEQHTDWSSRIQTLITANEYKPPYFPPKPEPKYYTPAPAEKRTVRGYW